MLYFISFYSNDPISPFTILEPRNQQIGRFNAVQERRETDFEARNLEKGRSGIQKTY